MYGDTDVMRRRVDQLREQAVDLRTLADQLVARTESLGWTGRAADSMRERVTERAGHLRSAAAEHDTAADSLDKHLGGVEETKERIDLVQVKAERLTGDARTRVAQITAGNETADASTRRTPDPDDQVLADFAPPAAGHKDWLTVELPGL